MNIFQILTNLFTKTDCKWVLEVEDKDISPPVILRFLSLNLSTKNQARVLTQFMYSVPPKMFLSAAWSIIFLNGKKVNKAPFIKYPKKVKADEKYDFIIDKMRKQFELAERDFEIVRPFVIADIEKNKVEWFSYYGVQASQWKRHNLAIDNMKLYGNRKQVEVKKGLDAFF
jgi:hypothetical protein